MRRICTSTVLMTLACGCSAMQSKPDLKQMSQQTTIKVPNDRLPQRPMGRTMALKDVQVGQVVTVLQYVDGVETWVTGQVDEMTSERITLVRCEVEERTPGKKDTGVNRSRSSRYTLPPNEIRTVRAAA